MLFLFKAFSVFLLPDFTSPSNTKCLLSSFAHILSLYPSTYGKLFNLVTISSLIISVPFNSIVPIVFPSESYAFITNANFPLFESIVEFGV